MIFQGISDLLFQYIQVKNYSLVIQTDTFFSSMGILPSKYTGLKKYQQFGRAFYLSVFSLITGERRTTTIQFKV